MRQYTRVFSVFVAKECMSRKEVGRNGEDYLYSAVFSLTFAPDSYFCLLIVN